MIPLHRDPHYTFRFAEDRLVPRFHLEGVTPGRRVVIYRLDPRTGYRMERLADAVAGDGGWVDLGDPVVVRAGEGFVAVPEPDVLIRDETPADRAAVFDVHRRAFGRDDEANLVDALRDGGFARVSRVAEMDGEVVGHVLFSRLPIETADGVVEGLSLAPVAVVPDRQRQGIGSRLIRDGLDACRAAGHRIVVVLGHADYYPRFGFSAALAAPVRCPFLGPHWMAVELAPGALAGVQGEVRYPPPFGLG